MENQVRLEEDKIKSLQETTHCCEEFALRALAKFNNDVSRCIQFWFDDTVGRKKLQDEIPEELRQKDESLLELEFDEKKDIEQAKKLGKIDNLAKMLHIPDFDEEKAMVAHALKQSQLENDLHEVRRLEEDTRMAQALEQSKLENNKRMEMSEVEEIKNYMINEFSIQYKLHPSVARQWLEENNFMEEETLIAYAIQQSKWDVLDKQPLLPWLNQLPKPHDSNHEPEPERQPEVPEIPEQPRVYDVVDEEENDRFEEPQPPKEKMEDDRLTALKNMFPGFNPEKVEEVYETNSKHFQLSFTKLLGVAENSFTHDEKDDESGISNPSPKKKILEFSPPVRKTPPKVPSKEKRKSYQPLELQAISPVPPNLPKKASPEKLSPVKRTRKVNIPKFGRLVLPVVSPVQLRMPVNRNDHVGIRLQKSRRRNGERMKLGFANRAKVANRRKRTRRKIDFESLEKSFQNTSLC